MININLLPETLRSKERMPMSHLLALVGALCLVGFVGITIMKYMNDIIPDLERQKRNLSSRRTELLAKVEELKKINAEIARLSSRVDAVKTLYRTRIVWSKILSDMKHIVNFDTAMSEYNTDMRYLWFTKLIGRGKQIAINGFSTSTSQVIGMQMPEQLLQGFLKYSPVSLPEKDEEVRLQEELRTAMSEYDKLRIENPDLPLQGPQEVSIRQRLEEIKNIKSGGIALQSFASVLAPGSLRLISVAWNAAPQPRARASELDEIFPKQAWAFNIGMDLK